ncbi:holin [Vibrio phage 1.208.B._10N.222.52.A7]|nr:holin [Vibrio phage 1.208.B._10N.222.52.A7]
MMDLTSIFSLGETVINKIWPDENKRAEEMRKLEALRQTGDLAQLEAHVKLMVGQMEVNKAEAAHRSIFVAGWRPAIGWICAVAIGWNFIGYPIAEMVNAFLENPAVLPEIATDNLFELVLGMLGLGGLRTYEKKRGLTK